MPLADLTAIAGLALLPERTWMWRLRLGQLRIDDATVGLQGGGAATMGWTRQLILKSWVRPLPP
jgi:hypothetical protein